MSKKHKYKPELAIQASGVIRDVLVLENRGLINSREIRSGSRGSVYTFSFIFGTAWAEVVDAYHGDVFVRGGYTTKSDSGHEFKHEFDHFTFGGFDKLRDQDKAKLLRLGRMVCVKANNPSTGSRVCDDVLRKTRQRHYESWIDSKTGVPGLEGSVHATQWSLHINDKYHIEVTSNEDGDDVHEIALWTNQGLVTREGGFGDNAFSDDVETTIFRRLAGDYE